MIASATFRRTGRRVLAAGSVMMLAAGMAAAAPYQLVSEGADGVWLLDSDTGAVDLCAPVALRGPKVIDVFGFESETREGVARRDAAGCEAAAPEPARQQALVPAWWPGEAERRGNLAAGGAIYYWWGPLPGRPLDSRGTHYALQPKVVRLPIQ